MSLRPTRTFHPYAMLAPTLAVLALFCLVPLGVAFHKSFFAWDLLTEPEPVGFGNYRALLASGELGELIVRTLAYSVVVVSASLTLGLALAVALNREGRFYAFVRSAVFSAYVVSWVAVALLWLWLLDPQAGLIARVSKGLGLTPVDWLGNPRVVLFTLAGVTVWKITGYAMVIFLAGLQDVPRSVLEAAALDGAGPWQRFRYIVWPLLRPTATFVATTSLILSFQAFDIVRVMTQGGPVRSSTIFVYAIYEQVFVNMRVGRASALTVVFFVLLLGLTGLQWWLWRKSADSRVAT